MFQISDMTESSILVRPQCLIRLRDQENQIVDVFDCFEEECFTLESFYTLINASKTQGKDFLLAKVTTHDTDTDKIYYSYYSAFQINKVLFRTQPEEGLIHRMSSRNPLNNMKIVGDVEYYKISVEEASKAAKEFEKSKPKSDLDIIGNNSSTSLNSTDGLIQSENIFVDANLIGTDNDFLMKSSMRTLFAKHSLTKHDRIIFNLYNNNHVELGTFPNPDSTNHGLWQILSSSQVSYSSKRNMFRFLIAIAFICAIPVISFIPALFVAYVLFMVMLLVLYRYAFK